MERFGEGFGAGLVTIAALVFVGMVGGCITDHHTAASCRDHGKARIAYEWHDCKKSVNQ